MINDDERISFSGVIVSTLVVVNVVILKTAYIHTSQLYWMFLFTVPLLGVAIYDVKQKRNAVLRYYPIVGRLKYFIKKYTSET